MNPEEIQRIFEDWRTKHTRSAWSPITSETQDSSSWFRWMPTKSSSSPPRKTMAFPRPACIAISASQPINAAKLAHISVKLDSRNLSQSLGFLILADEAFLANFGRLPENLIDRDFRNSYLLTGISVNGVKKRVNSIYRKAAVQNRVELMNRVLDCRGKSKEDET